MKCILYTFAVLDEKGNGLRIQATIIERGD
jgi:hypothetical protein